MVPKSHPRYKSLLYREKIVAGCKKGITAPQGLIAQGRGEAFDYILGEKTQPFALDAEKVAVALMLLAKHPVISVNGNTTVLVPEKLKQASKSLKALLEINIFYWEKGRVEKIKKYLQEFGVDILANYDKELKGLRSNRRLVDSRGIYIADVVLVPLEDGDRCEILRRYKKKVIAIDLNPLSRTARMADITIVDNVVRVFPQMIKIAKELKRTPETGLLKIVRSFDNKKNLKIAIKAIKNNLS